MFSSLKEKFLNVQEEITNSLRSLKLDRHGLRRTSVSRTRRLRSHEHEENVHYEAGMELLERYQMFWDDIHRKTVETAKSAEEADQIISKLHSNYEAQWSQIGALSTSIALIPKVIHGVQEVSDHILNVQCAFDETEEALLMLEDLIETQELREKQLEHRFQLALYQERREAELDDLKVKLTNEHFVKMKEFEKRKASELKVRQAVFQEAFEEDLLHYREGSLVTRTSVSESSPTLEEIELEEDTFGLEEFLADEPDDHEIVGGGGSEPAAVSSANG